MLNPLYCNHYPRKSVFALLYAEMYRKLLIKELLFVKATRDMMDVHMLKLLQGMRKTSRRLKRLKMKLSKTMRVKTAILKTLKLKMLKKTIYRYWHCAMWLFIRICRLPCLSVVRPR